MMIDGLELGKMTILAAMGIDSDGKKRVLGITEGGSENSNVVKGLLEDNDRPGPQRQPPQTLCSGWR